MLTSYEYSELWICLNCMNIGNLSEHGRCTTCDSDSVAVADTGRSMAHVEVGELERLFREPLVIAGPARNLHRAPAAQPLFYRRGEKRVPGHRRTSRFG